MNTLLKTTQLCLVLPCTDTGFNAFWLLQHLPRISVTNNQKIATLCHQAERPAAGGVLTLSDIERDSRQDSTQQVMHQHMQPGSGRINQRHDSPLTRAASVKKSPEDLSQSPKTRTQNGKKKSYL